VTSPCCIRETRRVIAQIFCHIRPQGYPEAHGSVVPVIRCDVVLIASATFRYDPVRLPLPAFSEPASSRTGRPAKAPAHRRPLVTGRPRRPAAPSRTNPRTTGSWPSTPARKMGVSREPERLLNSAPKGPRNGTNESCPAGAAHPSAVASSALELRTCRPSQHRAVLREVLNAHHRQKHRPEGLQIVPATSSGQPWTRRTPPCHRGQLHRADRAMIVHPAAAFGRRETRIPHCRGNCRPLSGQMSFTIFPATASSRARGTIVLPSVVSGAVCNPNSDANDPPTGHEVPKSCATPKSSPAPQPPRGTITRGPAARHTCTPPPMRNECKNELPVRRRYPLS
jgi:hypothetical protein